MNERVKLDIPFLTILKVALSLLVIYFLFQIREVLLIIFVVLVLAAALRPIIKKWEKTIGKTVSVLLLLVLSLIAVAGFIYILVPLLVDQVTQLINYAPELINRYSAIRSNFPSLDKAFNSLSENFSNIGGGFVSLTTGFLGGVVTFLTVIILTFYSLAEEKYFSELLSGLLPPKQKVGLVLVLEKISQRIGNWLRGQLVLGLVIGVIVFIGLEIIGLPYALTLAVLAAAFEIIPVVGPIISGALATLVGLSISPLTGLFVAIFYIVVQQIENNVLVPKIMQKAIGLPASVIIVAILIGSKLLGVLGALLAVPVSGVIYVIAQEWQTIRHLINDRKD